MDSLIAEFYDPRLVAIYDAVCPLDGYEALYLNLAAALAAETILDVGCGTGLLTYQLAMQGHRLIGLEPAPHMLAQAQQRLQSHDVQWIAGGVEQLTALEADLAIMTAHVAQFFLEDAEWQQALEALHAALRPGGHLAFESRNPLVQPWTHAQDTPHPDWPSVTRRRVGQDPVVGELAYWSEVVAVQGDRVRFEGHYLFEDGEERLSIGTLRFRSQAEIEQSLTEAGFSVETVYGDWDRRPATRDTPEMIFVARRD
jgi:SAM-dependent methyltransferase